VRLPNSQIPAAATSRALAQEAAGLLGGSIDILVNNAGIFPGTSTLATDEETFDRVYAVNVKSEAIAAAAVYLASDDAAFMHSAVLDIDGGRANVLTSSARTTSSSERPVEPFSRNVRRNISAPRKKTGCFWTVIFRPAAMFRLTRLQSSHTQQQPHCLLRVSGWLTARPSADAGRWVAGALEI